MYWLEVIVSASTPTQVSRGPKIPTTFDAFRTAFKGLFKNDCAILKKAIQEGLKKPDKIREMFGKGIVKRKSRVLALHMPDGRELF